MAINMDQNPASETTRKSVSAMQVARRNRTRFIATILPAAIGVIFLLAGQADFTVPTILGPLRAGTLALFGAGLTSVGLATAAWIYLQTGIPSPFEVTIEKQSASIATRDLTTTPFYIDTVADLATVKAQVNSILLKLESLESAEDNATAELSEKLFSRVMQLSADSLVDVAETRLEERWREENAYKSLSRIFAASIDRLNFEIARVDRKSNFNLWIGTVFTLIGIGLLGYSVLYKTVPSTDFQHFVMNLLPRLSLVLLLQIFAFFFLRLHRESLSEIKYYQNEITNVEMRHIALSAAVKDSSDENLLRLLAPFATVERNQVLKKGETTIELERARIDATNSDALIGSIGKISSLLKSK